MPIYEYLCPKCKKRKEVILSLKDSDIPQACECGRVMDRLISLPHPAIFITTNRSRLVNTLNDDEKSYQLPSKGKHNRRYKEIIGRSLFGR